MPHLCTAPVTEDMEPFCHQCNAHRPLGVTQRVGPFARRGIILTCQRCGSSMFEPTVASAARLTREVASMRRTLARLFRISQQTYGGVR